MTILSDWNQNLHAYSIPESLIKSINNQGSDNQIIFDDSNCNPSSIRFYFGNIPNEKILSQYHNLEWIHFGSIGIDKLRHEFIKERSLTITNGANTNTKAVVTYCIGEIFKSCKSGFTSRNYIDSNELTREHFNNFYHHMIDYNDINLCLLGYGSIGQELTKILSPLVKSINIVTKTKRADFQNVKFYSLMDLNEAIIDMSHMINVIPLHKETENIVSKKVLNEANSLYYICAGRAETHDISDILISLESGLLRGASLDVHGLPNGKIQASVLANKKIALTPHISGWTKNFWDNQKTVIMHNLTIVNRANHQSMKNIIYNRGIKIS